jgi:hypothetical protein
MIRFLRHQSSSSHCSPALAASVPSASLNQRKISHSLLAAPSSSSSSQPPVPTITLTPTDLSHSSAAVQVTPPPKTAVVHPAILSEINRSLFHSQQQMGVASHKRKREEEERDQLLHLIDRREVVCVDLNRLSFQQADPLLLLNFTASLPLHSKFCYVRQERPLSSEGNQIQFQSPMLRWREYSACEDLAVAYTQIIIPAMAPPPPVTTQGHGQKLNERDSQTLVEPSSRGLTRPIKIEPEDSDSLIRSETETRTSSVIDLTCD